ncbi:hypothetical protein D3C73_1547710 [compost metagenome]
MYAGIRAPEAGQFAVPIRRQDYRLVASELRLRSGASDGALVDGVGELQLELIRGGSSGISAVQLALTLADPQQRVRPQTYRTSIALGNPLDGS